jgi:hypothetical protein
VAWASSCANGDFDLFKALLITAPIYRVLTIKQWLSMSM